MHGHSCRRVYTNLTRVLGTCVRRVEYVLGEFVEHAPIFPSYDPTHLLKLKLAVFLPTTRGVACIVMFVLVFIGRRHTLARHVEGGDVHVYKRHTGR